MSTFLATLILTFILVSFMVIGVSLRMLLVKGGEYRGGCASNSPFLKNQIGECQVCGAAPGEACMKDDDQEEDTSLPEIN